MEAAGELSLEEINQVKNCESIGGDEEFFVMILQMLQSSLLEKSAKLERANLETDCEMIWMEAHSIKGSALQCSLTRLGNAAKLVEEIFKNPAAHGFDQRQQSLKNLLFESARTLNTINKLPA